MRIGFGRGMRRVSPLQGILERIRKNDEMAAQAGPFTLKTKNEQVQPKVMHVPPMDAACDPAKVLKDQIASDLNISGRVAIPNKVDMEKIRLVYAFSKPRDIEIPFNIEGYSPTVWTGQSNFGIDLLIPQVPDSYCIVDNITVRFAMSGATRTARIGDIVAIKLMNRTTTGGGAGVNDDGACFECDYEISASVPAGNPGYLIFNKITNPGTVFDAEPIPPICGGGFESIKIFYGQFFSLKISTYSGVAFGGGTIAYIDLHGRYTLSSPVPVLP